VGEDRQRLPHSASGFRCFVLNDADVSALRWKTEWLEPAADYCRIHNALFETVPASVFRKSGLMENEDRQGAIMSPSISVTSQCLAACSQASHRRSHYYSI
jgi:hypothetical protein